jgi:hypothetical protein
VRSYIEKAHHKKKKKKEKRKKKKRSGGVAQGVGPEFKPQHCQKKKKGKSVPS